MIQAIDYPAFRARYGIERGYVDAYLSYWNANCPQYRVVNPDDIDRLPPPYSYWIEYALSTNLRGETIHALTVPYARPGGGTYLDVGCGFGECVVAFARHGYAARGVDLDPQRVEFARVNTRDAGLTDAVRVMDILDDAAAGLGRFDVITCTDVIEHVLDPRRALERMLDLLAPGGVLLLEIPNKDSLNFVARDGHFGLFGIVQLGRAEAMRYHAAQFNTPYDVGYYHELGFYLDIARDRGCEAFLIDNPLHPVAPPSAAPSLLARSAEAFADFVRGGAAGLDADLAAAIIEAYGRYVAQLGNSRPPVGGGAEGEEAFRRRYLTDFWTLIVRNR